MTALDYQMCPKCREYAGVRGPVVAPHMAAQMLKTGEAPDRIMDRFMSGVHDRHLAGFPILPGVEGPWRLAGRYAALMAQVGGVS